MKIILSRKGFDSSAGGVPSPILPDGRLISLPIPDPRSQISYRNIQSHVPAQEQFHELTTHESSVSKLVTDLTRGRINATTRAHLDPDLVYSNLPRAIGWRPLFGQSGAAQGHLRNQQVDIGDVFLFFGLFQPVHKAVRNFTFDRSSPRKHIFFGWMQIGDIVPVSECPEAIRSWASYHPHYCHPQAAGNTLYIASDTLSIDGRQLNEFQGAGQFHSVSTTRTLTASDARAPSQWRLPLWFHPTRGKPPLSYHSNPIRWSKSNTHTNLQAASRGQEFVLNCNHYPEAFTWLQEIFAEV